VVIETASPAATRHAGVEEGDQHLSLDDMERDMIVRALRKHRNRRRDAAIDLGISERTLYRKIKQYDIVAE
jgi:transcriptional regulator with PAS, ATPase and Fis domain